jgi:hypothetical protein
MNEYLTSSHYYVNAKASLFSFSHQQTSLLSFIFLTTTVLGENNELFASRDEKGQNEKVEKTKQKGTKRPKKAKKAKKGRKIK